MPNSLQNLLDFASTEGPGSDQGQASAAYWGVFDMESNGHLGAAQFMLGLRIGFGSDIIGYSGDQGELSIS
jgi:hypothetical protein